MEQQAQPQTIQQRSEPFLGLKDVITMLVFVVSLTVSWMTLSNKIEILYQIRGTEKILYEKELKSIQDDVHEVEKDLRSIKLVDDKLENRLRDIENRLQRVWENIRKP